MNAEKNEIVRRHLLTASVEGEKTVGRIEVREVTLPAHQKTGLHLHPCPVVGYVTEGAIVFEIEGRPPRDLKAGDAFFEPAGVRVARFDNIGGRTARFIACYLTGPDNPELITMLSPNRS